MVQLTVVEDVEDAHFAQQRPYQDQEDDYASDSDRSSLSNDDGEVEIEETLYDRVVALKDIIPPRQRAVLSAGLASAYGVMKSGLSMGGTTLWVLVTGAFVVGVPFAVAVGDEQQLVEMERDMKMQQFTTDSLSPGAQTVVLGEPQKK
ncbi:mitochondrial import translocase, subunit Tom22 [Morchella conica CCBAS932]|uniref:Mitochondrial import translocase, subunit Tom22 n=1 Tax=Morchella conica CCBAS932 TaxID=1392247 RepID=A0A3N4L6J4_9PEZI|nr:mitochondrial import translocase, subunit Tom22 [Morchella conica CCBAS932]